MIGSYLRLIRFNKPIGTLLLLWPTLWAILIASNGHPPLYVVIVFSVGVFLTRSAGCAINDFADVKFDKHVMRTRDRPLVTGDLRLFHALVAFIFLSGLAFILALFTLKPYTLIMSVVAVLVYATYPFTKRFFAMPQIYMAVAFSFGILMVFIEIKGRLGLVSWLLFSANLFWATGYDTIYAMVDMEEDLKIKIKTSSITLGDKVVLFVFGCYFLFVLIMLLIAYLLNFKIYFYIFWFWAVWVLIIQVRTICKTDKTRWFKMFLSNNWVGMLIFFAILGGIWN